MVDARSRDPPHRRRAYPTADILHTTANRPRIAQQRCRRCGRCRARNICGQRWRLANRNAVRVALAAMRSLENTIAAGHRMHHLHLGNHRASQGRVFGCAVDAARRAIAIGRYRVAVAAPTSVPDAVVHAARKYRRRVRRVAYRRRHRGAVAGRDRLQRRRRLGRACAAAVFASLSAR